MPEYPGGQKGNKHSLILYFLITACVLILDQVTKFLIVAGIEVAESIPVIKGVFHITLVLNKGVAFGLFANSPLIPTVIGFVAIIAILIFFVRFSDNTRLLTKLGLSLILAGCIGNLIDRLRLGVVIDFLDFRVWPVFNTADSAISLGVALLLLGIVTKPRLKNL